MALDPDCANWGICGDQPVLMNTRVVAALVVGPSAPRSDVRQSEQAINLRLAQTRNGRFTMVACGRTELAV